MKGAEGGGVGRRRWGVGGGGYHATSRAIITQVCVWDGGSKWVAATAGVPPLHHPGPPLPRRRNHWVLHLDGGFEREDEVKIKNKTNSWTHNIIYTRDNKLGMWEALLARTPPSGCSVTAAAKCWEEGKKSFWWGGDRRVQTKCFKRLF